MSSKYIPSHEMSISCIHPDTLALLRGYEIKILHILITLWHVNLKRNPAMAMSAWPSLKYLARHTGKSLWTISRSISKFRRLRLISAFQPHKKNGVWQTNRYYAGKVLLKQSVAYVSRLKRFALNRLRKNANKQNNIYNIIAKRAQAVDNSRKTLEFVPL